MTLILVRYGELALKSRNVRRIFENALASNIRSMLNRDGIKAEVRPEFGRIYVQIGENRDSGINTRESEFGIGKSGRRTAPAGASALSDLRSATHCAAEFRTPNSELCDMAIASLRRVFGITSISPVTETTSKPEDIIAVALATAKNLTKEKSFAVRCRRTGKHEYSSQQLAAQVGDAVNNATGARVDLENPDFEISFDVRDKKAFVFTEKIRCSGGMPLGTQGRVIARMQSESDMLAAWLMMKRGVELIAVGHPKYFEMLEKWGLKHSIKIETSSYGELEKLALENGADAIVIGEKFDDLKFKEKGATLPILRPLVGMSDDWIKRKIVSIKS